MRLSRRELNALYANALLERDEARRERDNSRALARSLTEEIDRLNSELEAAKRTPLKPGEVSDLARARTTIARLDEQLRVLEASNLELSREAMARAGTAVPAVTG